MAESEVTLAAFYGVSSPWAYLGAERLVSIAKQRGVRLVHRPIRVIQANGGIPLRTRPNSRQQYHEVELDRWRKYLGIPLNLKPRFCTSIIAAALIVFLFTVSDEIHFIMLSAHTLYLSNTMLVASHSCHE